MEGRTARRIVSRLRPDSVGSCSVIYHFPFLASGYCLIRPFFCIERSMGLPDHLPLSQHAQIGR